MYSVDWLGVYVVYPYSVVDVYIYVPRRFELLWYCIYIMWHFILVLWFLAFGLWVTESLQIFSLINQIN